MIKDLPDHRYIAANNVFRKHVELQRYRENEHVRFDTLVTARDVGALIARYPIRETQALRRIASQLNFQTTGKYEMAVRAALVGKEAARNALRRLLGGLGHDGVFCETFGLAKFLKSPLFVREVKLSR